MDQLIFASISHTHYWYEVGMLKVPAYTRLNRNVQLAAGEIPSKPSYGYAFYQKPLQSVLHAPFEQQQATLHFPEAFWGMLLPVTVHGRVSDIWRSYFTQALLPSVGAVVAFAPAWVEQVRAEIREAHFYLSTSS